MAAENPMESLQKEATCPVCLEYFTEPVSLECGHNFCRACIRQCWEGSDTDMSCPQCSETVQQRNLRPNRQLCELRKLKLSLLLSPEGTMAAENPMESLQKEATCPVCLEYFTEPVSLECGHNFCRACIRQCWEGSDTDMSCPQCSETVQQRNLRPNRQLANMVEIAKRLSLQAAKGTGGDGVCREHQETLKLFCEEDQSPICVICRESRAHRAHTVVPIQEAAQEYKVQSCCPVLWVITLASHIS
uniref:RING-type E3 ubiquitin transferase n=1 Tax=Gopherus agassizii TaxID=38772 RepID=A0A452IB91_9SAUR